MMENLLSEHIVSNRDEIVGLPALIVRDLFKNHRWSILKANFALKTEQQQSSAQQEFLKKYFTPLTEAVWISLLSIPHEMAKKAFQDLILNGYLQLVDPNDESKGWYETEKLKALIEAKVLPPISYEESNKIIFDALSEAQHLNFSGTASRIEKVSFYGAGMRSFFDKIPFIEVEIEIHPVFEDPTIQRQREIETIRGFEKSGMKLNADIDRGNWSRQMFKNRLRRLSPYLCVIVS